MRENGQGEMEEENEVLGKKMRKCLGKENGERDAGKTGL